MIYMICRNRVENFERWKTVLDSHEDAHRDAGLRLTNVWRSVEEPENVFFVFEVASLEGARAFINHPDAAKAGSAAGVIDGEIHFVENALGY